MIKFWLYILESKSPIGIGNGLIPNDAITANSSKPGNEPWRGRLNNPIGCWCASGLTDIVLVIDLVFIYRIKSFASQGNPDPGNTEWVTSVSVMYKARDLDRWTTHDTNGSSKVHV
jgi:hypothetical protein